MLKKHIKKKFNYSSDQILDLVLKIDDYKNFLPWCSNSKILSRESKGDCDTILADLTIGYKFLNDTYQSKILYDKSINEIKVESVKGPLKKLENIWKINSIDLKSCEVDFYINLEFKNFLFNRMLTKIFDLAFDKIFTSFENRAKKIYG